MLYALNTMLLVSCALCALCDFFTYKIPNKILMFIAALFLLRAIAILPGHEITNHIIIGVAALGVGFILYAFKFIGAGDAKFIAVCMLWIDQSNTLIFILSTAVFGGMLALLYATLNKPITAVRECGLSRMSAMPWGAALLRDKLSTPQLGDNRVSEGIIPYGVAVFSGVLCTSILNKGIF